MRITSSFSVQRGELAAKKGIVSCFGRLLVVGVFFSGTVQSAAGKAIRDRDANKGADDSDMLVI